MKNLGFTFGQCISEFRDDFKLIWISFISSMRACYQCLFWKYYWVFSCTLSYCKSMPSALKFMKPSFSRKKLKFLTVSNGVILFLTTQWRSMLNFITQIWNQSWKKKRKLATLVTQQQIIHGDGSTHILEFPWVNLS